MWKSRKAKKKDVASVLLEGVREVNELATIRQSFQSIVMYEDSRSVFGFSLPGTHKKFMLKYSGNITVGTDLSRIVITQFVSGKVRVTLPQSSILDVTADMKSIKVYDQRSGLFNALSFDEQNSAIAANLLEIEAEARSGDLAARSDENARRILSSLCRNIGIGVEVEFAEQMHENVPGAERKPESAEPEITLAPADSPSSDSLPLAPLPADGGESCSDR